MIVKISLAAAKISGIVLAKVGNPQRNEPLETSKEVFRVEDKDVETLSTLLLKAFKGLPGHRFAHHSSLEKHEMNTLTREIFTSDDGLLQKGCDIARRLYSKSNHPNIKAGDLCIALVHDIEVDGLKCQGLCILKSESVVPFLSISARDGDLELHTEQGINPEKIDKGCLILDTFQEQGYYVQTFDRTGGESRFWVRDFLGVQLVTDSSFLTSTYAKMAVSFVEQQQAETAASDDDAPPWETGVAAREAMQFFDQREDFDLKEFEQEVLKTPQASAKFAEHRAKHEEEQGQPLESSFKISKKDVGKVIKKIGAVMKLDSGVEIHLKSKFLTEPNNPLIERGFDDAKGMKYVKIYYHEEQGSEAAGKR